MGFGNNEIDEVKKRAGKDIVVLLDAWKRTRRRYRIYRYGLCAALCMSIAALLGYGYYYLDSRIPSVIHVRAGQEQSFNLGVPAQAEIISVSEQGVSNIPQGAVNIDLNRSVTVMTGNADSYQMQVKLFGFLPFKQVGIQVIEDQELIPMGVPIGIYMKTDGILVVGTGEFTGQDGKECAPSKYILKSGDYVTALNGEAVAEKEDFIARIENSGGKAVILTVEREGETFDLKVQPQKDQDGAYKIGAWIRDNTQGIGTMTYIDSEGNFGALGHGINDVDTNTLMDMEDGTLYQTEIVAIKKGAMGNPGEMTGMIIYSDDHILGDITGNSAQGIFGECNQKALGLAKEDPLPIALKQEIQKGPAQILCTIDGTARYYDVEITDLHLDHDNVNRGIELTVTDPELIELTGGIIQGMSGAPIVQDGRIVGAVTHVLIQDSKRGYGIFIENMIE